MSVMLEQQTYVHLRNLFVIHPRGFEIDFDVCNLQTGYSCST